jgi:putative hydrolase of the HAD superfamily
MTKKYKHLLFDLDKTIWDFERNSESTIREIYGLLDLKGKGIDDFDAFHRVYEGHNLKLWELYRKDAIKKQELMVKRFADALVDFGVREPETAASFSAKYLEILPTRTGVFEGTHEALEYLAARYSLHIITNGFSEVQFTKLEHAGLRKFFTHIIISEDAGAKKPDKAIFDYALRVTDAEAAECLMIGDDIEVDLLGAKNAGIDQVFFNPNRTEHQEMFTFEIAGMGEMMRIL